MEIATIPSPTEMQGTVQIRKTAAVVLFKDTPGAQLHALLLEDHFKARLFTTIHLLVHPLLFHLPRHCRLLLQACLHPLHTLR